MKKREVETLLRASGVPFVNIDETKRALFTCPTLGLIHFVVYQNEGPHWLLVVGRTERRRSDVRGWERVFGDGFIGVFAIRRAKGILFVTAEGRELSLTPNGGTNDNATA